MKCIIILSSLYQQFLKNSEVIFPKLPITDFSRIGKKSLKRLGKNTWLTEGTKLLNCEAMDILYGQGLIIYITLINTYETFKHIIAILSTR